MFDTIMRYPDYIGMETAAGNQILPGGPCAVWEDVKIILTLREELLVQATAAETGLCYVQLRWNAPMPEGALYYGSTFERNYGTMGWHTMRAEQCSPWYVFASMDQETRGYGVKVRPGSMCYWQIDDNGVTLWMDIRSGTNPVQLGGRVLDCATVVSRAYQTGTSFEAARQFCRVMCTDPLLPDFPVYGSNNWYYAYGYSSHEQILSDAELIAELTEGIENRPFMVVDSCWQRECVNGDPSDSCAGGPNDRGNARFPDMPGLAAALKKKGLRPGIWMRFIENFDQTLPETWRREGNPNLLDPSVPEVLDYIANEVRQARDWGYELLKYDFTCIDILQLWGAQSKTECFGKKLGFRDQSRTTAELIGTLYRTIHEAAPELILIGCNCIGHLGAGLMHLYRTGDDTSGREWDRTRRMGVNTLAFRMPEDGAFYRSDADCVGIMGSIPWTLNRQWAELLAYSGTPFFASMKPGVLTDGQKEEMKVMFRAAAQPRETAVPLDWMINTTPKHWILDGREVTYNWYAETGMPRVSQ